MSMPRFNIGRKRLREATLRQMSMELLCTLPYQPHSADAGDLGYDLDLTPITLQQVVAQLWKDHEIRVRFTTGGELYIPRILQGTARNIANAYWEKIYGKEDSETQEGNIRTTEGSENGPQDQDEENHSTPIG